MVLFMLQCQSSMYFNHIFLLSVGSHVLPMIRGYILFCCWSSMAKCSLIFRRRWNCLTDSLKLIFRLCAGAVGICFSDKLNARAWKGVRVIWARLKKQFFWWEVRFLISSAFLNLIGVVLLRAFLCLCNFCSVNWSGCVCGRDCGRDSVIDDSGWRNVAGSDHGRGSDCVLAIGSCRSSIVDCFDDSYW